MDELKYIKMMQNEINTISSEDIRMFAMQILDWIPDYFFKIPASSSGKYHPKNDLGEGGLVRHSISVKRMLDHLLVIEGDDIDSRAKDLMRVAALFHDSFKSGTQDDYEKNPHTKFLHPLYAHTFIIESAIKCGYISYEDSMFIGDCIISHMGQWNTNNIGTLPLPVRIYQKLLHMADYLASRKDINMTLEDDDDEDEMILA